MGCPYWDQCYLISSLMNEEIECALCKIAGDTKLSGAVEISEGWNASQRELDKLEKWESCEV